MASEVASFHATPIVVMLEIGNILGNTSCPPPPPHTLPRKVETMLIADKIDRVISGRLFASRCRPRCRAVKAILYRLLAGRPPVSTALRRTDRAAQNTEK